MTTISDSIVAILREELEHQEPTKNYRQWLLGASIKEEAKDVYTARVVAKTNESPYVDGMDIAFIVQDEKVEIYPAYYDNAPNYLGGTVEDIIEWMKELDNIFYIQVADPYENRDSKDSNDRSFNANDSNRGDNNVVNDTVYHPQTVSFSSVKIGKIKFIFPIIILNVSTNFFNVHFFPINLYHL